MLLRMIVKRLCSHPLLTGLYACSLALCVGLCASPSLFADSVSQALMREELAARSDAQRRPTLGVRFYAMPRATSPLSLAQSDQVRAWLAQMLSSGLGLPIRTTYVQNESPALRLRALDDDERYTEKDLTDVRVAVVRRISNHLLTVAGAPFASTESDEALSVWVLSGFAEELGLKVGETFQLAYPATTWRAIDVQVAGIVTPCDPSDEFWYQRPDVMLSKSLLTTEDDYNAHVAPLVPEGAAYVFWYFVFDDARLNLTHATRYISALEDAQHEVSQRLPQGRMDVAPLDELLRGRVRKRDLTFVLSALTVPMIVILAHFLVIVASIYARSGARYDVILVSRGAGQGQLVGVVLVEAAIFVAASVPLGLGIGLLVARAMGLADGFMSFSTRDSTPVYLAALDWQFVAVAAALGVLARVWGASRHAGLSIIAYERMTVGRHATITGFRLALLSVLGVATWYAYRQLVTVGGVPLAVTEETATFTDPLLLLAPSLFLIVGSLTLADAASLLFRMAARLLGPVQSAPALVAFRQLGRESPRSRAPVFVLVSSLSLGVFYASLAHSAEIWTRNVLEHSVGADLVFDHAIVEGLPVGGRTPGEDAWYLPAQDYEQIEGVDRATRVADYPARARIGGTERRIRLIGIERTTFPEVAYFRSDYASAPLGELMNQLALNSQGVLVSTECGLSVGDRLVVSFRYDEDRVAINYEVVGTFRYFPTVSEDEVAVVANIASIFEAVGQVLPHSVWMRTSQTADAQAILMEIESRGVVLGRRRVLSELRASEENRREYIGMFGMMSINLIASIFVASIATLVDLFSDLVNQERRLALLRGIGFYLHEVIAVISIEYILIIGLGLGGGAIIGLVSSLLYVEYFPLSPTMTPVPPFIAHLDSTGIVWVIVAMLITSTSIMMLSLTHLRRQHIFEALRMG